MSTIKTSELADQADLRISPQAQCQDFLTRSIRSDERVLDVGCGDGKLMSHYLRAGCEVVGVEVDPHWVQSHQAAGLDVRQGFAERLPFGDGEFDRLVCSVVLPYTREAEVVQEWARVLKPGGLVLATYHGVGYGWNYLLRGSSLLQRLYGGRMLLNTACYGLTRRRLPGFLGDTLCQVPSRMRRFYTANDLDLETEELMDRCIETPRFIAHAVRKAALQRAVSTSRVSIASHC